MIILSKQEKESLLWLKLKAHFEGRLEIARKRNDSALDAMETARLRGYIAATKEFLGLDLDVPTVDREADGN